MGIELKFHKDDLETKSWIMNELKISESDFIEIRSFDGSAILLAVFVAIDVLVKNPGIIDKFLRRDGCEVEFDKNGKLLKAKGFSASEIIKLMAASTKKDTKG